MDEIPRWVVACIMPIIALCSGYAASSIRSKHDRKKFMQWYERREKELDEYEKVLNEWERVNDEI